MSADDDKPDSGAGEGETRTGVAGPVVPVAPKAPAAPSAPVEPKPPITAPVTPAAPAAPVEPIAAAAPPTSATPAAPMPAKAPATASAPPAPPSAPVEPVAPAAPPAPPATEEKTKTRPLVIKASRLSLTFSTGDGPVEALSNVDLSIGAGEFVSLIGPSGCGKTTLLRVIADLEQPTSGDISVNGMPPAEARARRAYGYVFQAPALYPWRNIARNVALPLEIMGLGSVERERRIATNLELVNLEGFERKYPWQLSGGMQQRVSIARALAVEPDLLLMDEPFGALDEIARDHLNEQLLDLWATTRKTVVFVTHSIPEAVFLSTKIVVMTPRPGKIYDVIDSPLPAKRKLDIRDTSEFLAVAHRVRDGLKAGHAYED